MELKIIAPGDHKTQSAVALVAYQYSINRSDFNRLKFYKEPICIGPTILHLEIKQAGIKVRLDRKRIIEVLNKQELPYLKVLHSDGRGVILPAVDFEMIVQQIEGIPPVLIDSNGCIELVELGVKDYS